MSVIDSPTTAELNELRDERPAIHPQGIGRAFERLCEGWRLGRARRVRWFDDAVSALAYLAHHPELLAETAAPVYRHFTSIEYDEACELFNERRFQASNLGNQPPLGVLRAWFQMDQRVLAACLSRAMTDPDDGRNGWGRRDPETERRLLETAVHSHVEAFLAAVSGHDEGVMRDHWRALIDAYRTGLWIYWVCGDEIVVVPRPTLHVRNGQLHDETGPAAVWPEGPSLWFLDGVAVTERIVRAPETLTSDEILNERNAERRRIMIERFGFERLIREAAAEVEESTDEGTLYRLRLARGADDDEGWLVAVEVTCPSTGQTFLLRVPPWMYGVREAIAWTFGMRSRDYRPLRET